MKSLTRISLVTVGNGDISIIAGVGKNNGTNGAVVLGILDFETTEQTTIFDKSNLALEINPKLH